MSLEAITKIRAVEDSMEQAKADARVQGQKLAAAADQEGRALLKQGEQAAAAAAAEAMRQAEEAAAKRREEILSQAGRDCDALRETARARMDKAVQAILERVVES